MKRQNNPLTRKSKKGLASLLIIVSLLFFWLIPFSQIALAQEIISIAFPDTAKANEEIAITVEIAYDVTDWTDMALEIFEEYPIGPETLVLDSRDFSVSKTGTETISLHITTPPYETEWELYVMLWAWDEIESEWVLLDEEIIPISIVEYQPPLPAPIITGLTLSNLEPIDGEEVTIEAEISNIGEAVAEDMVIRFSIDYLTVYEETITLAINETYISSFEWTSVGGEHTILVEAWDLVEEITITVSPAPPILPTEPAPTPPPPMPTEPTAGIPWWGWLAGVSAVAIGIWLSISRRKRPAPVGKAPPKEAVRPDGVKITRPGVPVELPPEVAPLPEEEGLVFGEEPPSKVERRGCLFFWAPRRRFPYYRPSSGPRLPRYRPLWYRPPPYRPPIYRPRTPRVPQVRATWVKIPWLHPAQPKITPSKVEVPPAVPQPEEAQAEFGPPSPTPEIREKEMRLLELKVETQEKESELKAKRNEYDKAFRSGNKASAMIKKLRQKLVSIGKEIEGGKLADKIQNAKAQVKRLQIELDRLSANPKNLSKEALEQGERSLKQKIKEWSAKQKKYEAKVKQLKAQKANIEKRMSDLSWEIEKSINVQSDFDEKREKLNKLKEEKKRLETELEEEHKKARQQKKK